MARSTAHIGRLTLTARGFGFVEASGAPSILVPFDHLGPALSGDTVRVEVFPDSSAEKPAGRVVDVVARNPNPLVGRVRLHGERVRLYAAGNRSPHSLTVTRESVAELDLDRTLEDGDVIEAGFQDWPKGASHPVARATALVARRADRDLELRLIALSRGFPLAFPQEVERAARKQSAASLRSLSRGRQDLTRLVCFTIDPDEAKDFDDAMSVVQLSNGLFQVGIHIADVSAYVEVDDPVDREAWKRGTSVYLVNTVLPMLPEHLSNGLCSLVPGERRLAVSVLVTMDSMGTMHEVRICESVIRSAERFTYRDVETILNGAPHRLAAEMHLLRLLTAVLRRRREERGSVDFDFTTPQVGLDENGVPVSVRPAERLESNRMVEECMLLANQVVADRLASDGPGAALYRVHDRPTDDDLDTLVGTLNDLGIPYRRSGEGGARDYRNILSFIGNFEFRDLVEAVAIKGLKRAVYATENRGHFGLAMDAYTHFTSPIRRYPDLVVHRLVKDGLLDRPGGDGNQPRADRDFLEATCEHASERERAAGDAEREFSRLKALEFLQTRVGRRYRGLVSGVATVGLFVEIERYLIEGLVHISTLGSERFELDRAAFRLVGARTGTVYRLGDRVEVEVRRVDPQERKADFVLVR